MREVSLNLIERTESVPLFSTARDLLKLYYEENPIDNDQKFGLLYDTFSLINDLFDIIGLKYDKETRLMIANYIYKLKGSPYAITELCRLCEFTIEDFSYKYILRGNNDLKAQNVYAFDNGGLLSFIYPTKLSAKTGTKFYGYITSVYEDLFKLTNFEDRTEDDIYTTIDELPSWFNPGKTTSSYYFNASYKNTEYTGSSEEVDYDLSFEFDGGSDAIGLISGTKITRSDISYKSKSNDEYNDLIKKQIISQSETFYTNADGSSTKTVSTVVVDENKRHELTAIYINTVFNSASDKSYTYSVENVNSKFPGWNLFRTEAIKYLGKNNFIVSSYTITEDRNSSREYSQDNLLDEELEKTVSFEYYDDTKILKEKTTEQLQIGNSYCNENKIISKSLNSSGDDETLQTTTTITLRETNRRTRTRHYSFGKPVEIKMFDGIDEKKLVNLSNEFAATRCYAYVLIENDNEVVKTDREEIEKLISVEEDKNDTKTALTYIVKHKFTIDDSDDTRKAQKMLWDKQYKNCSESQLKAKIKEDDDIEYNIVDKNSDANTHLEISKSNGSDIENIFADTIVEFFNKKDLGIDSRTFNITLNDITVLDKSHFDNVFEELIRDLLFVSNSIDDKTSSVKISVNVVNYNILSQIRLKTSHISRQISNTIPDRYISENAIIWKLQ